MIISIIDYPFDVTDASGLPIRLQQISSANCPPPPEKKTSESKVKTRQAEKKKSPPEASTPDKKLFTSSKTDSSTSETVDKPKSKPKPKPKVAPETKSGLDTDAIIESIQEVENEYYDDNKMQYPPAAYRYENVNKVFNENAVSEEL